MRFFSSSPLLHLAYPRNTIWKVNTRRKEIYLTFDDGPNPGVTDHILELLKTFNAKATFFMLGEKVETHPDLYQKILDQGHAIGNHTYNHTDAWKVGAKDFSASVEKCNQVFESRWFRPPYGRLPVLLPKTISENYKIIMWSLLSYDFDDKLRPGEIVSVFQKKTVPGSIWVFHDNVKAKALCFSVLPILLEFFSGEGFQFRSLDESGV